MVREPKEATLRRYGLSLEEWRFILARQGGVCAVCEKVPSTGRFVVDHDHVRGWAKMPPEQRKLYVRGILCWFCNHAYVGRAITVRKSENVTNYLRAYELRKPRPEEVSTCKTAARIVTTSGTMDPSATP